jgi:hypothetical protein
VLQTTVPSHGARLFRLGDNKATGIHSVPAETPGNAAPALRGTVQRYSLDGKPAGSLQKGIYVQQGKLFVK